MSSINSTLTCQVDGLVKVYTHNKDAYFVFENEEQLNKAKERVIQLWNRTDCTSSRNPQKKLTEQKDLKDRFSFGVSTKSEIELIKLVVSTIDSGIPIKTVPIKNSEGLKYVILLFKTSFFLCLQLLPQYLVK